MGTYFTFPRRRRRSVADTLLEAEHDHYLDCPNADLAIRTASLILDLILFSLASSGIHHLGETLKSSLPLALGLHSFVTPAVALIATYFSWMLKTVALFLYFIWTIARFGGSPAKLLMGLRIIDQKSGARLSYVQIFVRELSGILGTLLLVSPLVALVRADRRTLHDLASQSVVKRVRGDL